MLARDEFLRPRAERLVPKSGIELSAFRADSGREYLGRVENISRTGVGLLGPSERPSEPVGTRISSIELTSQHERVSLGSATVARIAAPHGEAAGQPIIGLAFDHDQTGTLGQLHAMLQGYPYVTSELRSDGLGAGESQLDASDFTLDMFHNKPDSDLFAKCRSFRPWVDDLQHKQLYQRLWRVTATGALDHRITVFDPIGRCERDMICFDSNSYLGLHLHPRVVGRVREVLNRVGFGTASAQMLCGTNRYLRELEEELSDFLGREDTIVFPTGFAANSGAIGALIRQNDAVIRDRLAHASIHEGCKGTPSRFSRVYGHNNMDSLETLLRRATTSGCDGKLVITDGVFSMHGRLAPLPELVEVTKRHGARLMVDDAHGLGVLGATGRGIEEHYDMPGSVDILMGTLSKSLGAVGGFVSGSQDLIYYLRFYAPSGMFTTTLPAPICAGLCESLKVLREEPEHRERLWENIRYFVPALRDAGFIVPDPVSPIVTAFLGAHTLMLEFGRDLFDAGVKCGNVMYPAVAKGESILRMTLNARHTREDLDITLDLLSKVGRDWGILHRTPEEIREIGQRIRLRDSAPPCSSTMRDVGRAGPGWPVAEAI